MIELLAGWSHIATAIVVLITFLSVVDVGSKTLAPWLSRVRESAIFRDLAMLIAPPMPAHAGGALAWIVLAAAALGCSALIDVGPELSLALVPVAYQPSKPARDAYDKLAATQKKIGDVFAAAGENLDFNQARVLEITGAKDSAGAVAKVREWNKEAEDLGKEYDRVRELDELGQKNKTALDEAERLRKQPVQQPPLPGGGGGDPRPLKRLGAVIVGSAAFKAWAEHKAPSACLAEDYGLREMKTLFQTSAGWPTESTRVPGLVIDAVTRPIQVLDIIPGGQTGQAAVVFMEETTRTHSAAERAEGAAYAESAFVLAEQSSTVRSIGDSIPVTDEQLEDVAGVESYLNQRLEFGLRQRLDNQVLNGNGTAPNLRGIINVTGIQTQAKGTDPVPDAVYKAMTKVRVTGRAFPNAFVVHPNDWQDIRLLRTADGIYIWGSPSEAGPERIWGIQVVQADSLAENTGLVGDFMNFCQLYERRGIDVQVGYVGSQFTEGKRTIRAGLRVAFVVYRAAAFATVTGI